MDFARRQLKKYGWKEGQGLGKDETGIAKPLKVGIKRDHYGVGASPGDDLTSDWWSKLFNKAASNISVVDDVEVGTTSENADSAVSLKKRHYGRHRSSLLYGGFVDSTVSYSGGAETKASTQEAEDDKEEIEVKLKRLSDEDLVRACGGRTGHKAARHGLRLGGKLKRLQDQEKNEATSRTPSKNRKHSCSLCRTKD